MTRFFALTLMTFALTWPAFAKTKVKEPEVYFYPSGHWSVEYVADERDGLEYQLCYISSLFNNGFFMQIKGSDEWVDSLEIDFRQPIFTENSTHEVLLSIPGINDKTLYGQATSTSNLLIGLQDMRDFYKDLRGSSVLDFTIDGNNFRFYMVGLANKTNQFEKCLATSTVVAKAGFTAKPIKPKQDNTINSYQPPVHQSPVDAVTDNQFKPKRRRRLSERLAAEIAKDPSIAAPKGNYPSPEQQIYASSTAEPEVSNEPIEYSASASELPLYYDDGIQDPPAPNWDNYTHEPYASGAPDNLLVPPDFNVRP